MFSIVKKSLHHLQPLYQVDKALQSVEEEAERIYKDERGLLLDDEAASTRDAMWVSNSPFSPLNQYLALVKVIYLV